VVRASNRELHGSPININSSIEFY